MNIHSENISSAKPIPVARHLKSNVEEIKFATGKSELGTVLVARSAAGVCAILIGNRADVLKRDLAGEFTDAKLVHDDRALRTDLDKTLTFIKTPAKGLDLRLDIRGTTFQRRVWDALLGVRVGYKITYAADRARAGSPIPEPCRYGGIEIDATRCVTSCSPNKRKYVQPSLMSAFGTEQTFQQ